MHHTTVPLLVLVYQLLVQLFHDSKLQCIIMRSVKYIPLVDYDTSRRTNQELVARVTLSKPQLFDIIYSKSCDRTIVDLLCTWS